MDRATCFFKIQGFEKIDLIHNTTLKEQFNYNYKGYLGNICFSMHIHMEKQFLY